MRKIITPVLRKSQFSTPASSAIVRIPSSLRTIVSSQHRSLAQVQSNRDIFPEIWFTSSSPPRHNPAESGHRPETAGADERTLKLGKSWWYVSCESKSKMLMLAPGYSDQNTTNPPSHPSRLTTSPRHPIPSH